MNRLVRGCLWITVTLVTFDAPARATSRAVQGRGEEPCTASVQTSSHPVYAGIQHVIGTTGSGYSESDLLVPEAVPLGVILIDTDTLLLKCLRDCEERTPGGIWTAEWNIATPDGGHFIDGSGQLVDSILNTDYVVYLPPRDLACDETRTIEIVATIVDLCPSGGLRDDDYEIKFQAQVERSAHDPGPSYYSVEIIGLPALPPTSTGSEPVCMKGGGTCCYFLGDVIVPSGAVFATVVDYPEFGMRTDEIRPISISALDIDEVLYECGVPPCPSRFASTEFCDGLSYTWSIVSGGGSFVHKGATALYKSSTSAGKVELKVTVRDCGGYCYLDTPPTELVITFQVYDLDFITQTNAKLPGTYPPTGSNQGLRISKKVTDDAADLNDCGGATPTFAGPTGSGDRNTYRLEIDAKDAPAGSAYTVRVRTTHAWSDYEGVPEYDHTFATIASSTKHRSDLHMRLVSNPRPAGQTGLPANYEYDDEACGVQSIYVQPGDWVTATLLVDDHPACTVDLPVERPWNETNLAGGVNPVAIRSATIDWFAIPPAAPHSDNPSWPQAAAFHARRMSEDWAQGGIRGEPGLTVVDGPYSNVLYLSDTVLPYTGGFVVVTVGTGSGAMSYNVSVAAGQSTASLASAIGAALTGGGHQVSVTRFNPPSGSHPRGYTILVDPKTDQTFMASTGTTGVMIDPDPLDWADATLVPVEAESLGLNLKPISGAAQTVPAVFVCRVAEMMYSGLGLVGYVEATVNNSVSPDEFPGMAKSVYIVSRAGDGNDGKFPRALGHEFGHFFMDQGGHPPDYWKLMYEHGPMIGDGAESPGFGKRLVDGEIDDARTDGAAFLHGVCVSIPERLDY